MELEPVNLQYATSRESTDIVHIQKSYGLFINGEMVDARSGATFHVGDPATEEPLTNVAEAGSEDVDLAVAAARRAYDDGWRDLPGKERAKYLFRIARHLQERAREFAVLESIDGGKPIKESRDVDVPLTAAHFFYYADGPTSSTTPSRVAVPSVGVAGQIIPWNFPSSWRRGSWRPRSRPATPSC